jgi:hypothetical protein
MKPYHPIRKLIARSIFLLGMLTTNVHAQQAITVRFLDSHGQGLSGGEVSYAKGSWIVVGRTGSNGEVTIPIDNLTANLTVRMLYKGKTQEKTGAISNGMILLFQTINASAKLQSSEGIGLNGGVITYAVGSWLPFGTTDNNGTVSMELLPASYTFRISYLGKTIDKTQDISTNSQISFNTISAIVKLEASNGNPLQGGVVTYAAGSWLPLGTTNASGETSLELLPGNYTFRIEYSGKSLDKSQEIADNPRIVFRTVRAQVSLTDSHGNGLNGGTVAYAAGSWLAMGTTDNNGNVFKELLPASYTFRMTFAGKSVDKTQDIAQNPLTTFNTVSAVIKLKDSDGKELQGGVVTYAAGSWLAFGTTNQEGLAAKELLPVAYQFRMSYGGKSIDLSQDLTTGTIVQFQTTKMTVRLLSSTGSGMGSGIVKYAAGSWLAFGTTNANGETYKELLPVQYTFRMEYEGKTIDSTIDAANVHVLAFRCVNALVTCNKSDGKPIQGAVISFAAGSWRAFGTTDANGRTTKDLLALSYTFRMQFGATSEQKTQDVALNPHVHFGPPSIGPTVLILSPLNGLVTNLNPISVAWSVDGVPQNTQMAENLAEGRNTIIRSATDAAGNTGTASATVTLDTHPPVVTITSPTEGLFTNQATQNVTWTVDGVPQVTQLTASLIEGANTITRSAIDAAGNTGTAAITITLDTQAPVVAITSPANGFLTNHNPATIAWTVDGVPQTTQLSEALIDGANTITRSATDAAGNIGTASVNVILDIRAPVVVITSPTDGLVTNQNPIVVSWTVDGVVQTTQLNENLAIGPNAIIRSATDEAGNVGIDTIHVILSRTQPTYAILSPLNGTIVNSANVYFSFTANPVNILLFLDGQDVTSWFENSDISYSSTLNLADGHHTLLVSFDISNGQRDTLRSSFNIQTVPPKTESMIKGRVINGQNAQPVAGAAVNVVETGRSVVTDANGDFNLPSGGFGQYKIKVDHSNYSTAMRFISADSGLDVELPVTQIIPLDTHSVIINPGKDTVVFFENNGVILNLPHNALSTTKQISATLFSQIEQLPNDQPQNGIFLFCVDLKPNGTIFNDSITVNVPNLNQLSAGAEVPLTYFNENTALWEDAGIGYVSDDGYQISFKTMHFSVFHGNEHDPKDKETPGDKINKNTDNATCPANPGASDVTLKTGDLSLSYTIPGGHAFTNIDVGLTYWSSTAKPRAILELSASSIPMTPTYMKWQINTPGSTKQWIFNGPTKPFSISYIWQADTLNSNLTTGLYSYGYIISDIFMPGVYRYRPDVDENLVVRYSTPTEKKSYFYGFQTVINRTKSPYGSGWAIDGVTQLIRKKGSFSGNYPHNSAIISVVDNKPVSLEDTTFHIPSGMSYKLALGNTRGSADGNHVSIIGSGMEGTIYWYNQKTDKYDPPEGSYDSLSYDGDAWIRKLQNGSIEIYSNDGLLRKKIDRKGNKSIYSYDAFGVRLLKITDEKSGKSSELKYDNKDNLCAVVDQFGRTTNIQIDDKGDLVAIETPDNIMVRQYKYKDHLAIEKDLINGNNSRYYYNMYGSIDSTKSPSGLRTVYVRAGESNIANSKSR